LRACNAESQKEKLRLQDVVQALTARQPKPDDHHKDEVDMLKSKFVQLEKQQSFNADGKMNAQGNHPREQIEGLEDENNRLRKELQSFDLEFFEQLEDLKFNYSEAKKKLTVL
jgi:DNA-dependent RNA polymerase auxiliary subunit epsilon